MHFNSLLNNSRGDCSISYAPLFLVDVDLDLEITLAELQTVLGKAKLNKEPGIDRIPYELC